MVTTVSVLRNILIRRSFYKLRVDQSVQFCHTVAMAPKKRMSAGQVKVTTKALKNIETNCRVNALGKIMTKTGVMLLIFFKVLFTGTFAIF